MNLNKILGMIILSNAFVSRLSACDNNKHITHPDSFSNQEVNSLIDNYENITISKDAKDLWTWTGNLDISFGNLLNHPAGPLFGQNNLSMDDYDYIRYSHKHEKDLFDTIKDNEKIKDKIRKNRDNIKMILYSKMRPIVTGSYNLTREQTISEFINWEKKLLEYFYESEDKINKIVETSRKCLSKSELTDSEFYCKLYKLYRFDEESVSYVLRHIS